MKKFISEILVFTAIGVFFITAGLFYLRSKSPEVYSIQNIAPPNMTNSISFNSKMEFIAARKADCIAVGSSMANSNLFSENLIDYFGATYLNLSSWGMKMKDIFRLIRAYSEFYTPRYIIIATNIIDFQSGYKIFDEAELSDYIKHKNSLKYHLKKFNLRYYLSNFEYFHKNRHSRKIYKSLQFDEYGAVLFEKDGFEISEERWNNSWSKLEIDAVNYDYLERICRFCTDKKIELIFIQTPFREGLLDSIPKNKIENHLIKCKNIISRFDFYFVDGTEKIWSDTLFTDGIHFNSIGADLFTEYVTGVLSQSGRKMPVKTHEKKRGL